MRINKTIERWFPAPDDPDKSEHKIKHLTPGEVLDTVTGATTQETTYLQDEDGGDLVPEMKSHIEPGAIQKDQFLRALRDWKNMFDDEGAPMECTEENKIRAMRDIDGYLPFVTECRERLAVDVEKEKEARIKNLSSS